MKQKKKSGYLSKYVKQNIWMIVLYLSMFFVFYGLSIYAGIVAANYLTEVTEANFSSGISILIELVAILSLSYLAHYIIYMLVVTIEKKIILSIKKDLIDHSFKISSSAYSKTPTGNIVTRINADPDILIEKLQVFFENLANTVSYLATLCILVAMNVWIGLLSIGFLILIAAFEMFRAKSNYKKRKVEKSLDDKCTSFTTELVRSEQNIKSQGLENRLKNNAVQKFEDKYKVYIKRHYISISLWLARCLLTIAYIGVLLYVGMFLLEQTAIVLATFVYIFTNREALQNVVWQYSNVILDWGEIKVLTKRVFELRDETLFPVEKFGELNFKEPIKGVIEFKNVSFKYTENSKAIFENLSFKIDKNKTIAFIGQSGCGKSTILNLIDKLYDVNSGEILIDDINIQALTKESLRGNINYLNQFPYLFNMSIRENMKLVNENLTDEDIIAALKKVDIWDVVSATEKGLDTVLDENAVNFSGGQKQRLSIARSFLKPSQIMLFDESTSSLDNVAQEKIMNEIDNLKGSRTIVIIAHRLSTIKNVDKIFYIENGKIADSGSYQELVSKNAKIKKLFKKEK